MQHLDDGRLQEWVDRTRSGLDAGEQAAIERHLAECASCADRLEGLLKLGRQTRSLLSGGPMDEAPDFGAVRERAAGLATGRRRRRTMRRTAWAASIVIAIGAGWAANEITRDGTAAGGAAEVVGEPGDGERLARSGSPGFNDPEAAPSGEVTPESSSGSIASVGPDISPEATEVAPAPGPAAARLVEPATPRMPAADVALANADTARATNDLRTTTADAGATTTDVATTSADPARMIRGRVTDEDGTPLPAAQVFLEGTSIGSLTGQDGTFLLLLGDSIAESRGSAVTLLVQQIGYRQVRRDLEGVGGDTLLGDVRLAEQALALDEIVVTGVEGVERDRETAEPVTIGEVTWAPRERSDIENAVGPLLVLPDLPLDQIGVHAFGDVTVSRVVQTLDGGVSVVLLQSRRPVRVADEVVESEGEIASIVRDGLFVVALGRMPVDSLAAVLSRVR